MRISSPSLAPAFYVIYSYCLSFNINLKLAGKIAKATTKLPKVRSNRANEQTFS